MLNLMLSGPAPRKAGAKLQQFHKTTKFFNVFYQFIRKFLDFHVFTLLITTASYTKTAISFVYYFCVILCYVIVVTAIL